MKFIRYLIVFSLFLSLQPVAFESALAAETETERTAKLIAGAKKEGKLFWYSAMNAVESEKLLTKFKEMYPFIKTGLYRANAEKLLTKMMAESRAGKHLFDTVKIGGLRAIMLKQKGLLIKYLSPQLKFFPDKFKDPDGYWTSMYIGAMIVAYNTKMVSPHEVPRSWIDLLEPKWKGKMGMPTNSYFWFANMLREMGEEKGLAYMKKLSDQNIQFRTGPTLNAQLLAAGEINIGIRLYAERIEQMKADGAPLEWVGVEPVVPLTHPLGISAHAPHPNAARLFVDFVLSKEGQKVVAGFYKTPTRNDVQPLASRLKNINFIPFDETILNDYENYVNLYRKMRFR